MNTDAGPVGVRSASLCEVAIEQKRREVGEEEYGPAQRETDGQMTTTGHLDIREELRRGTSGGASSPQALMRVCVGSVLLGFYLPVQVKRLK